MADCNVSSDVLYEILSRVELKTLRKCRLVSRECNSFTYESSFMQLHYQRTKTLAGYFIQSLARNRHHSTFVSVDKPSLDPGLSLDFLPDRPLKILATADQGLAFCVSQHREHCYYICKSSTKQWEIVPSPNPQYFPRKTAMLVLGSDPLLFKLVRLSDVEYNDSKLDSEDSNDFDDYMLDLDSETELYNYQCFRCEIFDSKTWAWKQIDDLILPYDEFLNSKPAVSAYGGLHWLTSNHERNKILSFHENKENWELVALPNSLGGSDHWRSVELAKCEGKLTLICIRSDFNFVELWRMKDYFGEKLWTKKHTLNLKTFHEDVGLSSAISFYNADTLLMTGAFRATFYNFKNGQFDRLELGRNHMHTDSAFFIQTNYEPVQLRQYPTQDSMLIRFLRALLFIVFCFFIRFYFVSF